MTPHSKEGLLPDLNETMLLVEYDMVNRRWHGDGFIGERKEVAAIITGLRSALASTPSRGGEDRLREALVRIERFASMMVPMMPLYWKRNNEAAIVQMANDFADLRAAHQPAALDGTRGDAGESERHQRAGAHLFQKAREDGWQDDGEGAYEYMIRRAYEAGMRRPATSTGDGLLREALQRIQDEPDHMLPIVTAQRLRNIAGFALLGERLP